MDGIEKLSRLSLVACDQSYDALVAKGVSKLAPYPDSGTGDIPPNTMPASFYDPVYVGLNDWTVFDRIDDAQTGFGATIYTRVANDKTDFMVALQGTRGPSAQDWNGNLGFGLDKWNSADGGQLLNRVFSDLLRGTNDSHSMFKFFPLAFPRAFKLSDFRKSPYQESWCQAGLMAI